MSESGAVTIYVHPSPPQDCSTKIGRQRTREQLRKRERRLARPRGDATSYRGEGNKEGEGKGPSRRKDRRRPMDGWTCTRIPHTIDQVERPVERWRQSSAVVAVVAALPKLGLVGRGGHLRGQNPLSPGGSALQRVACRHFGPAAAASWCQRRRWRATVFLA